jgi:LacI family transcriptional regulator
MGRTPRVVLLMDAVAGYDRCLGEGIARYSQIHGPWEFLLPGENPAIPWPFSDSIRGKDARAKYPVWLPNHSAFPLHRLNANGVIGRIQTPAIGRTLLASGLPIIGIELSRAQLADRNPLSRISEIRDEGVEVGHIAAEHLRGRGFTHFGFCGFPNCAWSDRRQRSFCESLRKHPLPRHVYLPPRKNANLPWPQEQLSVTSWLQSLPRPIGILACNDLRGRQLIDACRQAGLRVPDDVAVLGVDDDRLFCELANPPLSSVALNLNHAGYQAAELLDGLMSGHITAPKKIMVQATWVVERRSTSLRVVSDGHVVAALRFIDDHFRQAITVDDVVAAAQISRRALEICFKRHMGRSIREDIQRARLDWSKKLLGETNLTIEKIAGLAGFCDPPYMSRVFQRQLHMSPNEYRLQSRKT